MIAFVIYTTFPAIFTFLIGHVSDPEQGSCLLYANMAKITF